MKLMTFINYAYIDITHNLYLQLKKFNRHRNLIIICTDEQTNLNPGRRIVTPTNKKNIIRKNTKL